MRSAHKKAKIVLKRRQIAPIVAFGIVSALTLLLVFAILSPSVLIVVATTNNVVSEAFTVSVPNTCIPILGNTLIHFGTVYAGSSASTSNAENVINYGNAQSNILVDGGNWISGSLSFLQTNTLWDIVSRGGANGNQLSNSVTGKDTFIPVQANSGANQMFFGLNIPAGQSAGTYTETINVLLAC